MGLRLACAIALVCVTGQAAFAEQPSAQQKIALTAKPSVVRVWGAYIGDFEFEGQTFQEAIGGTGTGFFITGDGYIATNAHVVADIYGGDDRAKKQLTEQAQRNAILVETLTSPQTVKASRAEGQFLRNWENSILASSETQSKIKYYQQMATQTTATLSQLASIGILIGGTYAFADHQITTGAIIAAMMLSSRVAMPPSKRGARASIATA